MATVTKWAPFGVALDITATGGTVTRTSATQFTVVINASWKTYYDGARTTYGMEVSSGYAWDGVIYIPKFDGEERSSGRGSFTGTYSIDGNGSATKTVSVTFRNYNTDKNDSSEKNVTFNVTVPAWTSYKINYNANGGSGAPGSQTKWKDQALTLSSTKPTRTGYSFLGWSTSSTATTATYSAGGTYPANANAAATLYAVWKVNTYKVTYNANGGSNSPVAQTKEYGKTLTLTTAKPTRTNYTFKGWAASASATTASYQAGGSYTTNAAITLYAVWELTYKKPSITDISATRSEDGTAAQVSFNWSTFLTVTSIEVSLGTQKVTPSASGTSGSVTNISFTGLNPELSYTAIITVSDSNDEWSVSRTLPGMIFAMDIKAGAKGVSVGKAAELDGVFDIGFQTRMLGGMLYPVLPEGTDLNDLRIPNIYSGENTSNVSYGNCPITAGTFTLEVLSSGPNGQIIQRLTRCDKTSPLVFERVYYGSAWSDWTGGWIYATLTSDFVMYGESESDNLPKYRKDGRLVEVRGIVKPTTDIAGSTTVIPIFTLPNGYRPDSPVYVICQGSSNCVWLLRVATNGEVGFSRYRNGDATATASAGTWLPFQVTFFSK